jgi:hypothetical protein
MRGRCLCAAVEFEISGEMPAIYQCHCSLCRRITGSSANAATIVERDQLSWLRGEESIRRYATDSGYQSHFCAGCGSPLPNPTREDSAWWVPVGLLDEDDRIELALHLYTGSKARWDSLPRAGEHYETMPDRDELHRLLHRGKSV